MKRSNVLITVLTITALLAGAVWLTQGCPSGFNWNVYRGFHPRGAMMSWGGMGIMLIFWGAVLILLVVIISRLFEWNADPKANHTENPAALDIVRQRYANGEIDRAEFEAKMKDLGRRFKPAQ